MTDLNTNIRNSERFAHDLYPDFREAIPTPNKLDYDGCVALLKAVTLQTAEDYFKVCDQPYGIVVRRGDVHMTRDDIERFIDETMPTRGEKLKKTIKEIKSSGKSFNQLTEQCKNPGRKIKVSELIESKEHRRTKRSGLGMHAKAIKIC